MKTNSNYPSIHSEGALLPMDLLERVAALDPELPGLKPQDYGLSAAMNASTRRSTDPGAGSSPSGRLSVRIMRPCRIPTLEHPSPVKTGSHRSFRNSASGS